MRPTKNHYAKASWHPRAREWFNSLKESGQADYFQESDWALAKICADLITYMYQQKFYRMATILAEVNGMMARLGTSEGDRRQTMRVELDVPVEEDLSEAEKATSVYEAMLGKMQDK